MSVYYVRTLKETEEIGKETSLELLTEQSCESFEEANQLFSNELGNQLKAIQQGMDGCDVISVEHFPMTDPTKMAVAWVHFENPSKHGTLHIMLIPKSLHHSFQLEVQQAIQTIEKNH